MKRWIFILVILAAAAGAGGWAWFAWGSKKAVTSYRTVRIERGDIIQTVRATGTVQPVKLVQVGTQVNGPIMKLGADFNTQVKTGDLVAQIDPAVYQANLAQADANLTRSRASVDEARANCLKASNDLVRAQGLAQRLLLSQSDLDAAVATAAAAEAELKVAIAQVQQTEAALQLSKANLGYTTICAPVDGTVVSRNVDAGQTVVASMSAQTLFTIATDLHTVLISASVPEADIGSIHVGQKVTFNVDAYSTTFTGIVNQVRLASSTVQNVVTYPVIVEASNPDLRLFPGMTANISCIVAERQDALKVPEAALSFRPDRSLVAAGLGRGDAPAGADDPPGRSGSQRHARLWVAQADGKLRPIRVTLGITDGIYTEVTGPGLQDNLEIVTGVDDSGGTSRVVNPFMPNRPDRRRSY